jgi:hypothetical protein
MYPPNIYINYISFERENSYSGQVPIGDIKNVKETDYVIKTCKNTHFVHN